jgi:four helix bundle protein
MPIISDDEFLVWERGIAEGVRGDPIWRFNAYRVSLFMFDLANHDARLLRRRKASAFQVDQLLRAVASISANIAEGLGRNSAAERSRFFGIALGSLREAVTWYHAVATELGETQGNRRTEQLTELRRLLIGAQKWLSAKPAGARLM